MFEKKETIIVYIISVVASFLLASLWHFLYDWFTYDLVALIAPVNESVWEHVKLFFFPVLIVNLFLYKYFDKLYPNFFTGVLASIVLMPILMFIFYYGYRVLGFEDNLIVDIFITILVLAIGFFVSFKITLSENNYILDTNLIMIILLLIFTLYAYLTYYPPQYEIFKDSESGEYGIKGSNS